MLGAIGMIMIVAFVLSLVDPLEGAEASLQRCRDEILTKTGFFF